MQRYRKATNVTTEIKWEMEEMQKTACAVIFDMDGTLFDTEVIYGRAWIKAGLTKEQYYQLIGRSRVNIDRILTDWGYDLEKVRAVRSSAVEKELEEHGVPLKPGARECLVWLKEKGIPAAIATSSAKEVAERYLDMTGLNSYFAEVISGNTMERGKPYPDIFLEAAKLLRRDPSQCVVVEDSFNGVRAGRNAQMITVMVPDLIQPDGEISGLADTVLESLNELPGYLQHIITSGKL